MSKPAKKRKITPSKKKVNKQKKGVKKKEPQGFFQTKNYLYPVLLFAFGFLLFANTIGHDFVLDDDIVTRKNEFVNKGIAGIGDIFTHGYLYGFNGKNDQSYRPLVLANMALETQFFGQKPGVYHFFNVFYFALSGMLLFIFLKEAFEKKSILIPLAISLLFVAHPIHTEVVANIKSRDEILSFIFVLTSLWSLLRYGKTANFRYLAISLFCYFLCVLAKETGLAMLGLVPFTLFFFTDLKIPKILINTAFFAGVAALYFLIRINVMDSMTFEEGMSPINNSLMAAESGLERFATNVSIMGRYLLLLVFPHPLSFDYSYAQIPVIGMGDWRFLLSFLSYAGLIGFVIWGTPKKHPVAYGILFFGIMLALVSNFLTIVGAPMAERFIFNSSLGFCIAIGYLLVKFLAPSASEQSEKAIAPNSFWAVLGVILVLFSLKTVTRNMDWKNPESLYTSGLKTAPNSARAHNHYASFVRDKVEANPQAPDVQTLAADAELHYKKALEIYPQYTEASYNLGVLLYTVGRVDEALQAYLTTLEIQPDYVNALNNSGVIYFNQGNLQGAQQQWNKVLEYDPNNAQVMGNLGAMQQNAGNLTQAIEYYEKSLEINPANATVLKNIILLYERLGNGEKVSYYQNLQSRFVN